MAIPPLPPVSSAIKAIETNYAGYRFRSRLEARWAVFFDALGWSWKYEHEGYVVGGYDPMAWLPDFEISIDGQEFYVEVKGDPNFFADGLWLDRFDYGAGPPGFSDSLTHRSTSKPLLVLGAIPRERRGCLFIPVVSHHKGIVVTWEPVDSKGPLFSDRTDVDCFGSPPMFLNFQPVIALRPFPDQTVLDALAKARSARFEHGEKP